MASDRVGGQAKHKADSRLSILALPLLLSIPLYLRLSVSTAAQPAAPSLPTLRLDYFTLHRPQLPYIVLDPAFALLKDEVSTVELVQAGLVRLLPSGKPVPDLARWTISKSHLVYTFTIRSNARFGDGHDVTAAGRWSPQMYSTADAPGPGLS